MKNLIISMLTLIAMASCEKAENPLNPTDNSEPLEISLKAGINTIEAMTKSVITGNTFSEDTKIGLYAIEEGESGYSWGTDLNYNNDGTVTIDKTTHNISIKAQGGQEYKFYYPTNNKHIQFYAYYPQETTSGQLTAPTADQAPTVKYTIDGQTDILYDNQISGTLNAKTTTNLVFSHKLAKIDFKIIADASFTGTVNVTKIVMTGCNTECSLNIGTGDLTFESTPAELTSYTDVTGIPVSGTLSAETGTSLIEPGTIYGLKITAGGTEYTVSNLTAPAAGKQQIVTLTFKGSEIEATASIKEWENENGTNADVQK